MKRLSDATIWIKHAKFKIHVSNSMLLDLEMWLRFLDNYNGVTLFPERLWVANDSIQLYTDIACGPTGGFGIFFQDKWAFGWWPQHWSDLAPRL